MLDFEPDLVTLVAGSNDAFSRSADLAVIEDSLDAACQRLTQGGAHLLLFTVTNVFDKSPKLASFGERIADLNSRILSVGRQARGHARRDVG